MPPGFPRKNAIATTAKSWADQDPVAATVWAEGLAFSEDRERGAFREIAASLQYKSLAEHLSVLSVATSPSLRVQVAGRVGQAIAKDESLSPAQAVQRIHELLPDDSALLDKAVRDCLASFAHIDLVRMQRVMAEGQLEEVISDEQRSRLVDQIAVGLFNEDPKKCGVVGSQNID